MLCPLLNGCKGLTLPRTTALGQRLLSLLNEICSYQPLLARGLRDLPWQCRPHAARCSLVTNRAFLRSLSQTFCCPWSPAMPAAQMENYSSITSGRSPVAQRWLCGSSRVPKAAAPTARSPAPPPALGEAEAEGEIGSGGQKASERLAGVGLLCPLVICLAHQVIRRLFKARILQLDQPQPPRLNSRGGRTQAKPKPSPCSPPRSPRAFNLHWRLCTPTHSPGEWQRPLRPVHASAAGRLRGLQLGLSLAVGAHREHPHFAG